jgi:hypothetical protein
MNDDRDRGATPRYLTVQQWIERKLPPVDYLLGHLLSTTTRMLFAADSGAGKSHLALALAFAVALGQDFLCWKGRRKGRVLLIDGEMPRVAMRGMIEKALKWFDVEPADLGLRLKVLSAEDYEDMQPLDTPKGQVWVDKFVDREGPFDLIIFDNLQALTEASLKEEDGWRASAPWCRSLTKRNIGQLWIHHTGKDASKGDYGTAARRWGMDTILIGSGSEEPGIDMGLRFTKARNAVPGTFEEFAPMQVKLTDQGWSSEEVKAGRKNESVPVALKALKQVMDGHLLQQVPVEKWKRRAIRLGISGSKQPEAQEKAFRRAVQALIKDGKVEEIDGDKYRLQK